MKLKTFGSLVALLALVSSCEEEDAEHGRIERRRLQSIEVSLWEDNPHLSKWEGLKSIHQMTRVRREKKIGKVSEETSYYISSLTDQQQVFRLIRDHWGIENKLHYMLDLHFREDYSMKRAGNAAQNMNIINKINLTIIQHIKTLIKANSTLRLRKRLARMSPLDIAKLQL